MKILTGDETTFITLAGCQPFGKHRVTVDRGELEKINCQWSSMTNRQAIEKMMEAAGEACECHPRLESDFDLVFCDPVFR
jgi:hypothetical protein